MAVINNKKRLNIGLFVNNIYNDYSSPLCKGAAIAAEELDVNLYFIPGKEVNAQWRDFELSEYEYQNNILYSYITQNNIDVLLISMGTVGFFLSDKEVKEFLERYSDIKVIIMEMETDDYPCIVFSLDGLKEAIEHIIIEHGRKKIAFVSGPKEHKIADKRLQVYKNVLREYGMEYDENYVVYGDFTEYCEREIRLLLDRTADNPPDAICFANDSMVLAGYKVFEEKGIKAGVDIAVTGFDDAAFADVVTPSLTTVKSYIMTMGYCAVESAVKYHETGKLDNQYVKTALIKRTSCGCSIDENDQLVDGDYSLSQPRETLIKNISDYVLTKSSLDVIPKKQKQNINCFINSVIEKIILNDNFSITDINADVSELVKNDNIVFFTLDSLNALINVLKTIAFNNSYSNGKSIKIYSVFEMIYKQISEYFVEKYLNVERETVNDQFVFSRMADDMMANGQNEDKSFFLMMQDINKINIQACYVYLIERSVLFIRSSFLTTKWESPKRLYLKAFCRDGEFGVLPSDQQVTELDDIFSNSVVMPDDKRKTVILQALYYNEEQYGLMLIDTDVHGMMGVENLTKQICTSIKMTRFMNLLEGALLDVKEANAILSRESVLDQLTGIYNRRGFLIESEKILERYKNVHCIGAVVFADLDNLKKINDGFGHDDGDFAIKKASSILRDNLRVSDIVGRIGGDEFVAFIIDIDQTQIDTICERIKKYARDFNIKSDKPYNVDVSLGVYCFDAANNETIDQLMTKADHKLYESKKNKNKTPIKSEILRLTQNDK